jgi:predicted porin
MKKTLVAAAVAAVVAAPAASFADVKIGGNVIQEFVSDGDETGSKEDGLESKAAVDLVFSVSEDLGNGMSAFAKIHTLRDNGGSGNADQVVGLKGDFGTLVVGRMEDFSEGKVAAMAATDSSDALSIEPNGSFNTGRNEGGIAYISPSFNGLTFGVAGYALPNMGSDATSLTITSINALSANVASRFAAASLVEASSLVMVAVEPDTPTAIPEVAEARVVMLEIV